MYFLFVYTYLYICIHTHTSVIPFTNPSSPERPHPPNEA